MPEPISRTLPESFQQLVVYRFFCRRCGREWTLNYTVRRSDARDCEVATFRRDGVPTSPPSAPRRCPACGGMRVSSRRIAKLDAGATEVEQLVTLPADTRELLSQPPGDRRQ